MTTVRVQVRYFASVREALGEGEVLDVADGTTLSALRDQLIARSAAHAEALAHDRPLRCALNMDMCSDAEPIRAGGGAVEVAFFPPVTGG
ncbi:MoaD/ThiS family protein [Aquabacterium sp.]|uniref:MoaD/ThiS family protein n=1 Tax=Aquabacterium sp. TaxID=1872578 RepID=UPI0035B0AB22